MCSIAHMVVSGARDGSANVGGASATDPHTTPRHAVAGCHRTGDAWDRFRGYARGQRRSSVGDVSRGRPELLRVQVVAIAALGHLEPHRALDLLGTRLTVVPPALEVDKWAKRAATRRTPLRLLAPLGRRLRLSLRLGLPWQSHAVTIGRSRPDIQWWLHTVRYHAPSRDF